MVAVCVEETRAVPLWHAVSEPYAWPESGTRVVVGWWDRRCAREGLGKYRYICGITSTYVVAEAYMRSTGSVGSDTWPHTHGEGCTRRARGRSEQRATDASKNIGVFCGYTLVSGLSRGYYVYAVRGWHTRQWGSHAARCENREGHSPRGSPKA